MLNNPDTSAQQILEAFGFRTTRNGNHAGSRVLGEINRALSRLIVNAGILTPQEKSLKETIGSIAEFRNKMSEKFGYRPTPAQEVQAESIQTTSPSGNLPISLAGDKLTDIQIRELAKQQGLSNTGQIGPLRYSLASRLIGMVGSDPGGDHGEVIGRILFKLGIGRAGVGLELTGQSISRRSDSAEQPSSDTQLEELVETIVSELGSDNWDQIFDSHILGRWGIARPLTELLVKRLFGRLPARGGHPQFTHKQITWLLFVQQHASQIRLSLSQLENKFDEIYAGLSKSKD